jgi:hypothetical protein
LCSVDCLNRIFEEASVVYAARPRPDTPASVGTSKKRKDKSIENPAAKKAEASQRRKVISKKRDGVEKTSAIEKALARPMKHSKKHSFLEQQSGASGLVAGEKIGVAVGKRAGKLRPSISKRPGAAAPLVFRLCSLIHLH